METMIVKNIQSNNKEEQINNINKSILLQILIQIFHIFN
jgi:hypothetical protein